MPEAWRVPRKLGLLDVAFPAHVSEMMPPYEGIPKEFRTNPPTTKWGKLFSDWFYFVPAWSQPFFWIKGLVLTPKSGIDRDEALGVIRAVMGSFEPAHEHKAAAVAYLLSLWFEDASWERGVEKP